MREVKRKEADWSSQNAQHATLVHKSHPNWTSVDIPLIFNSPASEYVHLLVLQCVLLRPQSSRCPAGLGLPNVHRIVGKPVSGRVISIPFHYIYSSWNTKWSPVPTSVEVQGGGVNGAPLGKRAVWACSPELERDRGEGYVRNVLLFHVATRCEFAERLTSCSTTANPLISGRTFRQAGAFKNK